jgi:hypothetical protein
MPRIVYQIHALSESMPGKYCSENGAGILNVALYTYELIILVQACVS